ncbi:MAG: hypothetical protein OEV80_08035, partial [candidate division Zixibacteria bacterium]|nr:hypothetical protein [candidate division Zixibacteria bacterium]
MDVRKMSKWIRKNTWIMIALILMSASVARADEARAKEPDQEGDYTFNLTGANQEVEIVPVEKVKKKEVAKSKKVVYTFDLAGKNQKITIDPDKEFEIVLKNAVPLYSYTYEFETITLRPEPLSVTEFSKVLSAFAASADSASASFVAPPSCLEEASEIIVTLGGKLENLKDEADVVTTLRGAELKAEILYGQHPDCSETTVTFLKEGLARLRHLTERRLENTIVLKKDQQVTIKVNRPEITERKNKVDTTIQTWEFTLSTGELPHFEILYGFSFITNGFNKGSEYHSRQIDSGSYEIVRNDMRGWGDLDYSPTVFAAWYLSRNSTKPEFGFMGGIGTANETMSVAFGSFVSFKRNLGIGFGVAVHQVHELRSKYKADADRSVTESL